MAFAAFEQNIFIAAPPETVHGFLAKTTNLSEIHPLIIQIQQVNVTTTPDGAQIENYRIRDRMKVGPLTISFTYLASASIGAAGELVSDAYYSPRVHVHNITICQAEGNGSRVKERIEITAPCLLMKTTYDRALSSHTEMIANLKHVVETIK